MKYLLYVLGVMVGALAIVAGEADGSPGLQGLGLILVLTLLFRIIQGLKSR